MQRGDRVYYLHTNNAGLVTKFPALILSLDVQQAQIRIGRMDVLTQKIVTAVYTVDTSKLTARNTPCNYEDELRGEEF
ncbi:MAG: hypothetical protein AAF420_07850 [Pseudomonadota bacterium]